MDVDDFFDLVELSLRYKKLKEKLKYTYDDEEIGEIEKSLKVLKDLYDTQNELLGYDLPSLE